MVHSFAHLCPKNELGHGDGADRDGDPRLRGTKCSRRGALQHRQALSTASCKSKYGECAHHVQGDGARDEIAVYDFLAQPGDKAQCQQMHLKRGVRGRHWPCLNARAMAVRATSNSAGKSSKCAKEAVDELHPSVEGVEVGVVVTGVMSATRPLAAVCSRMMCLKGGQREPSHRES